MFVFVRNAGSLHLEVFGPATEAECRAWMHMKGLHPGQVVFDPGRRIASSSADSAAQDWEPVPGAFDATDGRGGVLPFTPSRDVTDNPGDCRT